MKHLAIILASCAIAAAPFAAEARTPVICTMEYAPVCGTDAKGTYRTYGNGCMLSAEGGTFQHQGECTDAELAGRGGTDAYVPPAHCTAWFDGCNSCGRGPNGETYCTLKACLGDQSAGHCTAYGDTEVEVPEPERPDAGDSVSSPAYETGPTASVEATTTASVQEGFFVRIWNGIASWLGGLF